MQANRTRRKPPQGIRRRQKRIRGYQTGGGEETTEGRAMSIIHTKRDTKDKRWKEKGLRIGEREEK